MVNGVTLTVFKESANSPVCNDKSNTNFKIVLNSPKQFLVSLTVTASASGPLIIFGEKNASLNSLVDNSIK